MKRYFTIGMAGHIDHGKTTLTKALTGIDTDRLKEEKERNISIELGYALFIDEDDLQVSIVDVPGHERFIRQMVAGVAGIDMVVLVVSADEGVMPQTREHLDILSFLGIEHGIVALTKIDQTDEEMLELVVDDVNETLRNTFLEKAPLFAVDSLSGTGIPKLKEAIIRQLEHVSKKEVGEAFRLPIDQVFTVKGQGTVVRGTIYNGVIRQDDRLRILPANQEVRVRQIQVHRERVQKAYAGQRTALNLGGIDSGGVQRGDVLVNGDHYVVTDTLDVVFHPLKDIDHGVKQRQTIKLHIGTSEVMGKIVFFDRNDIPTGVTEEILCQLQLDDPIVTLRGDRYVIRRPSPVETIGGGWIIDPNGKPYRFGRATIDQLAMKKEGTAFERIQAVLEQEKVASEIDLIKKAAVDESEWQEAKNKLLEIERHNYTLPKLLQASKSNMVETVSSFHSRYPMRVGIDKAKLFSELKTSHPESLLDYALATLLAENVLKKAGQFVALFDVKPSLPEKWKERLERVVQDLKRQGLEVNAWCDVTKNHQIPEDLAQEFFQYLLQTEQAVILNDGMLITTSALNDAYRKLKEDTNSDSFTIQDAKASLNVSRKYLVPLLELFDRLLYTKRVDNYRTWLKW